MDNNIFYISYYISAGYDEGRLLDSKDFQRNELQRKIRARKWAIGKKTENKNTAVQLYKVTGSSEWFPLGDIAPRN